MAKNDEEGKIIPQTASIFLAVLVVEIKITFKIILYVLTSMCKKSKKT